MITKTESGNAYSTDFLRQLHEDLRQLAIDREKSGGTPQEAKKLMQAVDVVRKIEMENDG